MVPFWEAPHVAASLVSARNSKFLLTSTTSPHHPRLQLILIARTSCSSELWFRPNIRRRCWYPCEGKSHLCYPFFCTEMSVIQRNYTDLMNTTCLTGMTVTTLHSETSLQVVDCIRTLLLTYLFAGLTSRDSSHSMPLSEVCLGV